MMLICIGFLLGFLIIHDELKEIRNILKDLRKW